MRQSKHPRLCCPRVTPGCKTVFFMVCFMRLLEENGYLCWGIQHSADLLASHQQARADVFNTGTANHDVCRLEILTGKAGSVHTSHLQLPHLGIYNILPSQLMDRSGSSWTWNGLQRTTLNSLHPLVLQVPIKCWMEKGKLHAKGFTLGTF